MIKFDRVPIIKGLELYKNQNNTAFHMPGHKQNQIVFEELEFLKENIYSYDLTEVPGTDNLYEPIEMIKDAQMLLAEAMGSQKSYMLVNGSTCGIYSMILGLLCKKDKIIVQRNCHKSVFAAIYLGELNSIYVYPKVIKDFAIASTVDVSDLAEIIKVNKDAKAVVITSPSYYGTCADIIEISKLCKENNMLLIVDEAHGAHFNFSSLLPETSINLGADIAVTSFHKTLPAFTQTAVLNLSHRLTVSQIEKIESKLQMFQSSSPSYLFLASIDMARYLMETKGEMLTTELKENIDWIKAVLTDINEIKILDESHLENEIHDFTRIVINTPLKGSYFADLLRTEYNIQVEMADFNNIVLVGTVSDSRVMYEKLVNALKDIFVKSNHKTQINKYRDEAKNNNINSKKLNSYMLMPQHITKLNWHEAEEKLRELVELENATGRISAESLIPYPPGVPLILPGEELTSETISYINDMMQDNLKLNKSLSSKYADKIYVVKV